MTRSTTVLRSFTALAVAVGFAASLAASQYPSPAQKPAEQKMAAPDAKSVTVAGCVREGDTPNSFVLANADVSSIPALSAPTGTTGAPAAPGTPATATIGLISSGVDLKAHVGHKVEVTGTIAGAGSRPSGTTGTPPETTPAAEKEKGKEQKAKINVSKVKHVSDTCPM